MPDQPIRSPARLLAPIALVAFVVALLLVLGAAGTGDDDDGGSGPGSAETTSTQTSTERDTPKPKPRKATYTVVLGDTLGGIAEKTGVDVETLEELNPELDPQALVTGQQIKLRE